MNTQDSASTGDHLISSVEAGRRFGYTSDYVAKLAREGKVEASRVGQQWFVGVGSLASFVEKSKEEKRQRAERVREERKLELMRAQGEEVMKTFTVPVITEVVAQTGATRDHLISSVEAGRRFGYTSDYVAKLAREGKVEASRVGQQWFVGVGSLASFVEKSKEEKRQRAERVREERKLELMRAQGEEAMRAPAPSRTSRAVALVESSFIVVSGVGLACLIFFAVGSTPSLQQASIADALMSMRTLALQLYGEENIAVETKPQSPVRDTPVSLGDYGRDALMLLPEESSEDDIKQSFSDPVNVTFDEDGRGGIITPVFEDPTENPEAYRFLLVPVDQP